MNSELTNLLIGLAGLGLGVITTGAAGLTWYVNGKTKAYAAERDFAHIKRNYEQAQQALCSLQEDNDKLHDTLIEMKAYILGISNRLEGIAARLDSATGGWSRRNEG
ncbi:hypothetical protein H6G89_32860 [Oscillatoria sp. FACHB-1407]|uniref:hypothetical protein n=1 Tax=Oscillatoria sp. FACHB-1407 TaxID=2692847 RepID=UPI00168253E2|nr:hypothetical protein [Oscillatoria sp. FACHB-1407]MBD2465782.1 hypothetical protein [Oscillatoria sp. FACHB-1407]